MATTRDLRRGFAATTTTRDPEAVWRRWTDPSSWGAWDRGLRSAELPEPFVPGARGTITGLDGRRSAFVVREVDDRRRVVVEVPLPAAAMVLTRTLDGDAVDHQVSFTGPLGAVFAALLGRRFRPLIGPTVDAVAAPDDVPHR